MILILTYLCCTIEQDPLFQQATNNINAYYDTCVMIASNPEDC
jgi:hypothetical protein